LISQLPKNYNISFFTNSPELLEGELIRNSINVVLCYEDVFDLDLDIIVYDSSKKNDSLLKLIKQNQEVTVIALDNFEYDSKYISIFINLFDQNPSANKPRGKRIYTGLKYSIISDIFFQYRRDFSAHNEIDLKNIMIIFGGSDPNKHTINTLKSLLRIKLLSKISVILGPLNNIYDEVKSIKDEGSGNIEIFVEPKNLPELMSNQQLAFSGCATTFFELSYLGVPSIIIPQNKAEKKFSQHLYSSNLTLNTSLSLSQNLYQIRNLRTYNNIKKQQMNVFDGNGLKRISEIIEKVANA
jgi:spore coat polysaccharide biosynthesis predicted glycosyltransferase SpsG